jgi:hypothetical protein
MADIDIGSGATNRSGSVSGGGYTDIDLNNPANGTGTLTSVEIWANTDLANCEVGTFYLDSGTTYVCRSSAVIGAVTAGAKRTTDVSGTPITVNTGDYLGIYYTSGKLERDTEGNNGLMYYYGKAITALDSQSYTFLAGDALSIYATGTVTAAWTNIAKLDGVAIASISKVDGIVVGSIAKVCGVAV